MTTKPKTPKKTTQAAKPAEVRVVRARRFTGTVVRVSAAKTIAVEVTHKVIHPKYRKQYVRTASFLVHDEKSEAKVGDSVVFVECRPISKLKRWRLMSIVK